MLLPIRGGGLSLPIVAVRSSRFLAQLRESWIKGSSDSRTIYFGQTVGLWRYKIEDFIPCPDGTLLCVEGKLGYSDM